MTLPLRPAWQAGLALLLLGAGLYGYADGPPPAHTGGFGEPTCYDCHFDGPEPGQTAALRLDGLPETVVPGTRYPLTVTLVHPGMARAGFQLSARHPGGRQAGVFLAPDSLRVQLQRSPTRVVYAAHTRAGNALTAPDTARWRLLWQAPATHAPVVFHLAANAANGDDSAFGDVIFLRADSLGIPPE